MRWWALLALVLSACAPEGGAPSAALGRPDEAPARLEPGIGPALGGVGPVLAAAARAPVIPADGGCGDGAGAAVLLSPRAPRAGAPIRIVAVSAQPTDAELAARGPDGRPVALSRAARGGGPPTWAYAEIAAPAAGRHRVVLGRGAAALACKDVDVAEDAAPEPAARPWGPAWASEAAWSRTMEDLYSAWIERLFDAPLSEQPAWPALADVLRDRRRNFLHDHLGLGEDDPPPRGVTLEPDCADLPYFLRGYFAFKLGLPFGFSSCTRGAGGAPPACLRYRSSQDAPPGRRRSAAIAFGDFLRVTVADTVHSGSGRIPSETDGGDYYPVAPSAETLRPGTIYADPYGHVLVVVRRVPQTESAGGILLAVDGQPDGTVARRRYWRGNFLFALDRALGSPGFKRFRPVVREGLRVRSLSNEEIARHADYGDYSRDQYLRGEEGFYDRMDAVLSPAPRDPAQGMLETIQALEEQVRGRVLSVKNGDDWVAAHRETIDMPKGPEIFETVGPWEDFSTPSRDLRLLIAIDVVRGFPARAARQPARWASAPGRRADDVRAELEATLARELAARKVAYRRSDGSEWTLSLADVAARAEALEIAYNPNDCAEVRWGAPEGSDEARTCLRRAPWGQQARMRRHRAWFHERRRPPRE